jgi:hypothetical protein
MDEHDDDLASEVIEGEEIESDAFDPDDDVQFGGEEPEDDENAPEDEDDSEL